MIFCCFFIWWLFFRGFEGRNLSSLIFYYVTALARAAGGGNESEHPVECSFLRGIRQCFCCIWSTKIGGEPTLQAENKFPVNKTSVANKQVCRKKWVARIVLPWILTEGSFRFEIWNDLLFQRKNWRSWLWIRESFNGTNYRTNDLLSRSREFT